MEVETFLTVFAILDKQCGELWGTDQSARLFQAVDPAAEIEDLFRKAKFKPGKLLLKHRAEPSIMSA